MAIDRVIVRIPYNQGWDSCFFSLLNRMRLNTGIIIKLTSGSIPASNKPAIKHMSPVVKYIPSLLLIVENKVVMLTV